ERDHRALAVDAIHPRPDDQAEQEVGEERGRGCDPETHRRVGELVDEERDCPLRERATEVGDRLSNPELLEIGAHATSRNISSSSSCRFGDRAWIAGFCDMYATRRRRSRTPSAVRRMTRTRLSCVAGRLSTSLRSDSWPTTPARFDGSTPQRLASSFSESVSPTSSRHRSFACEYVSP